jgi:hypothetical protein
MIKVKKNIEHVIAFGCSYTFGEELPEVLLVQSDFFKKNEQAVKLYNRRKTKNFKDTLTPEDKIFWYNMLKNNYSNPTTDHNIAFDSYRNLANQMSYAGRLYELLNAKTYQNLSISGASNHLILMSLIMNKHTINNDSLVIIGLTHPLRKTQIFSNYNQSHNMNYQNCSIFIDDLINSNSNDLHLVNMLPVDNDSIIQELHLVYQFIKILKDSDCSYILYDPSGQSGIELLEDVALQCKIPPLFRFNNITEKDADRFCFLGHPSNYSHEQAARVMFNVICESQLL